MRASCCAADDEQANNSEKSQGVDEHRSSPYPEQHARLYILAFGMQERRSGEAVDGRRNWDALDAAARAEPDTPSRSEFIRRIVTAYLREKGHLPR